jgi:hypothetical protein
MFPGLIETTGVKTMNGLSVVKLNGRFIHDKLRAT